MCIAYVHVKLLLFSPKLVAYMTVLPRLKVSETLTSKDNCFKLLINMCEFMIFVIFNP